MRKGTMSIEEAKKRIGLLKGEDLKVSVNKGRKRIVRYEGQIRDIYPSVFTLTINGEKNIDMLSFSYCDLICGDIRLAVNK